MENKTHFFKILLGDFPQRLRIPPKFAKSFLQAPSNRVKLHDPNGKTWSIDLESIDDDIFFSNGWSDFVDYHSLNEFEFLVFKYDGNMDFNVLMFDKTGCEKEDDETSQETDSSEESVQCGSSFHDPNESKVKEEQEAPSYSTPKDVKYTQSSSSRKPVVPKKLKSKKAPAYSFSSTFPCFYAHMTAYSVNHPKMLKIPISFCRAHLPTFKTVVSLRDPSGKVWKVVYIFSKQRYFSGGWGAFLRGNKLKEGDICVFELVAPLEFRISVLKVPQHTNDS